MLRIIASVDYLKKDMRQSHNKGIKLNVSEVQELVQLGREVDLLGIIPAAEFYHID